jgi:hypothetical protein
MVTSTHLKFKRDRMRVPGVEERFHDRDRFCSYARVVLCDLADEMYEKFGVELTLTEAYRTPEENRLCGGAENSLHQTWPMASEKEWVKASAGDIRTWDLNDEQIKYAQEYVRRKWFVPVQAKLLYEPHAIAGGHLHLQTLRFEQWSTQSES